MCDKNSNDGKTTDDIGDAVELVQCLASDSQLTSAMIVLKELFPTYATEIENRFRGKKRTPEVDREILEFYVKHGGDISKRNKNRLSGLEAILSSSYFTRSRCTDPMPMTTFLVENGADVNYCSRRPRWTLLHELAGSNIPGVKRLEVVKYLLTKGADPFIEDDFGHDVISEACMLCREDIVDFICKTSSPEQLGKVIRSLELFGAVNLSTVYEPLTDVFIDGTMGAWLLANRLKQSIKNAVVCVRDSTAPNLAYNPTEHFVSYEELQRMAQNMDSMRDHAINLLEKFRGPVHPHTLRRRLQRALQYKESGDHQKWLSFLKDCFIQIYSFKLSSGNRGRSLNELVFILDVRSHCYDNYDRRIRATNYVDLTEYLQVIVETVTNISSSQNIEHELIGEKEGDALIQLMLYILVQFCRIHEHCNTSENVQFKQLLRKAVRLNLRGVDGNTMLLYVADILLNHLELDCTERHMSDAINLLLECGADVNERDISGNTIGHRIASGSYKLWGRGAEMELIRLFVDWGLHIDARNREGIQVSDLFPIYFGAGVRAVSSLQCLAASAIQLNNVPYKKMIPKALCNFVEMH